MFWKKEEDTGKKIVQINEILKKSFANVKRDTTNIFQWLNYFHRKFMEQEQAIKQLQSEISYIPKTREDIRRIVDDYYSFEGILARIRELNSRVDELARRQNQQPYQQTVPHELMLKIREMSSKIDEIEVNQQLIGKPSLRQLPKEIEVDFVDIQKRIERLEQKKVSMKEKIMKRLTRNSKEYLKSVILSYIKKYERISALQLKEIVVDEQNFCSKSSFYRLLEEIEQSDDIGIVRQGKEKHYLSKAVKSI